MTKAADEQEIIIYARAIRMRAAGVAEQVLEGDLDEEVAHVIDELLNTELEALGIELEVLFGPPEEDSSPRERSNRTSRRNRRE